MGDPRRLKRTYDTPKHPWEKERILEENKLIREYGLKNKREIWKAKTEIRKYRHLARELVGMTPEERKEKEEVLMNKLKRFGILSEGSSLDDVLSLKAEDLLKRRLQTIVWKKGLAKSAKQARQLITHGHIALDGRKVTAPGMIIAVEKEDLIEWYGKPIITEPSKREESGLEDLVKEAEEHEAEEEKEREEKIEKQEQEALEEAEAQVEGGAE